MGNGLAAHQIDVIDVKDLKMLLEPYFIQANGALNKLDTLRENIDITTENRKNQLKHLKLILECGTFCVGMYSVVPGIFGMNIPFKWDHDPNGFMFKWVIIVPKSGICIPFRTDHLVCSPEGSWVFREVHVVIPIDTIMKNIAAAASRRWISLDSTGEATALDVDSHSIMQRAQIHARDLHMLDPLTPSTILGREKAILVNLEHIKAIITAQEVLLRGNLTDNEDNVINPVVDELKRRLGKEADESPFEFRALEIALKAICSFLDDRATELETAAYPRLDELRSKPTSTRSLDCVHKLKRLEMSLKKLLDDDGDMAELYLSRKMASSSSPISSVSGAPNRLPAPAFKISTSSRGVVEGDENDVKELEMLLEPYFVQVDHTLNKLTTLREDIDDTEDYIKIQIGNRGNHFLQMEDIRSSGNFCLSLYNSVTGTFGMNIPFKWAQPNYGFMFKWVIILPAVVCVSIFVLIISYARRRYKDDDDGSKLRKH
ncbi:hypothetical protein MKW92_039597 [Papaver armeniacum]|nr:hypothetical protein MKW92_039597 [Papaver armeniacum]